MRLLVVDNYDSFTYNLVQYLEILGAKCVVRLNDAIDVDGARALDPDGILVSPGPCSPNEAGVSLKIIEALGGERPLLGVCLGHQAIAQVFGGHVVRAGRVMHGKTSPIEHDGRTIFAGLPRPFVATRYHSLIVEPSSLPSELEVSAWTTEGEIMGLRHARLPIEGVQFHPESILTTRGMDLLHNWLDLVKEHARARTGGALAGALL
ncbi:anthranilate synthase component II [Polyangium jinanense]|uniref:Aminodeoxychorismate/anthranilate synthase component II n=1 Tax=Polyangium jinanense TaxID=2829994 RepID=A0A9X3XFI5_9BACT|nr:aminodeoxychorismate/anthranilate synthase component II [Polyangium jinanense]MDC3961817.1 aminodeoxychorismate/anthranilate synthase component II [Polyangium jinanense]MDC3988545.1 aminodeoxychorismate/anthranilate synthase component II [Polyangium jinanense]